MNERIEFLGCPIDSTTMQQTVQDCLVWCRDRKPRLLVTVNAAMLVMMRDDPALRQACHAGALIVPDGMPVVWASRLIGQPLKSRVAGCDLMGELLKAAAKEQRRVFLLGAKEEVVGKLARELPLTYPGLVIAGYRNGYFKTPEHPQIITQIQNSRADILLVGMPTPFKELWCYQHREALGVPVIFGVGGSFDVHAGVVKRAPKWLQQIGMEWSWRLAMEPRKMWKRYLVTNTIFISMFFKALVQHRLLTKATP